MQPATLCVPKLGGHETEDHYGHNNSGRNRAIEESVKQTCHALLRVHAYFGPGTEHHRFRRYMQQSNNSGMQQSNGMQQPSDSDMQHPNDLQQPNDLEDTINYAEKEREVLLRDIDNKINFFNDLAMRYGRSALFMTGGAANGYYHLGVVRALLAQKMLPRVITGSSAGSLIGALTCCKTDEELAEILGARYQLIYLFTYLLVYIFTYLLIY